MKTLWKHLIALSLAATACAPMEARAQCPAPASWFPHEQTPEPDFHAPTSNCEFHQWAYQEFLWLTQPTGPDRIRLLDLPSADQLFMPGKAPGALTAAVEDRLKTQPLVLMPRVNQQSTPTSFGDIRQAGSKGLLVDQNGRAVYFGSHVNSVYYNFVRSKKLFLKSEYLAADPNLTFPVKSLELKSSWRIVKPGESTNGFFTTQALVNPLTCANGANGCAGFNVVIDRTKVVQVTVALVGLHVVGVVQDHPEFVWATFEHHNNAPDLPPNVGPADQKAVSPTGFTFYAASTKAGACNQLNASTVALNPTTQQLLPITNVFREFAFGQGKPPDTANIQALNNSVQEQLDPKDVWRNYFLVGSVWFAAVNGLKPGMSGVPANSAMQNLVTGSIHLSNSTMETFSQPTMNCFSCHDTKADGELGLPKKNLNISHILKNGLLQREQVAASARHIGALALAAPVPPQPPLNSFNDVKKLLNDFVQQNNVPIAFAPHRDFWNTLSYQDFISGNIPGVLDPTTQMPMRILVPGNSADSNLIKALRGTPGTVFDPNSGDIGRMPPSGPFMSDQNIDRLAAWIDANCPQ